MWESPLVAESRRLVGYIVRARASGPTATWHAYSSARRLSGASQWRSVKRQPVQHHKPRGISASAGRCAKSSRLPSGCEPGAGRLLPFRGVRVRPRRANARDVRQVWRGAGASRGRRWTEAGALAGWLDNAGGRRGLSVRRASGSCEARLWRQRRNAGHRQKSKAQSQPLGSCGKSRPSTCGSRACRLDRSLKSLVSPSPRFIETSKACWRSPSRKPLKSPSKPAKSRSSRSTEQSRGWTASSSEVIQPRSWLSCDSTSGAQSFFISRKRRSNTRAPMAHRCRSTNAGP